MIIQPVFITVPANSNNSATIAVQDAKYRKIVSILTRRTPSYDVQIQEQGSDRTIARIPSDYSDNAETFLNEFFSGLNLVFTVFNNTASQITAYIGLKLMSTAEMGMTNTTYKNSNIPVRPK